MIIKFEPSGTHAHKDILKVRLDLYAETTEKSYAQNYVSVPIIPLEGYPGKVDKDGQPLDQKAYDDWLTALPHIWQLNPSLSVFVAVDENVTKQILTEFVGDVWKADQMATIDDIMTQANSIHLISSYMKQRTQLSTTKTTSFDTLSKTVLNDRFFGLVIGGQTGGTVEKVIPQSLDMGYPAANGNTSLGGGITWIDLYNPSNGNGTFDTVHAWANTNMNNVNTVGTFYYLNPEYYCRDSEAIGNITSGALRTFTGLTIEGQTGDFIGIYWDYSGGGILEANDTGGTGVVRLNAEYKDPGDHATPFTTYSGYWIALDATGTESGGGTVYDGLAVSSITTSTLSRSNLDMQGIAVSNIKLTDSRTNDMAMMAVAQSLLATLDLSRTQADFLGITKSNIELTDIARGTIAGVDYNNTNVEHIVLSDLARAQLYAQGIAKSNIKITGESLTKMDARGLAVSGIILHDGALTQAQFQITARSEIALSDATFTIAQLFEAIAETVTFHDVAIGEGITPGVTRTITVTFYLNERTLTFLRGLRNQDINMQINSRSINVSL